MRMRFFGLRGRPMRMPTPTSLFSANSSEAQAVRGAGAAEERVRRRAEGARRDGCFHRIRAAEVEVLVASVFVDEVELHVVVLGVFVANERVAEVACVGQRGPGELGEVVA